MPGSASSSLLRRPRVVLLDAGNTFIEIRYDAIAAAIEEEAGPAPGGPVDVEALRRAEWRARADLDRALGDASTESTAVFQRYMLDILRIAAPGLPAPARARIHERVREIHAAENLWTRPHPRAAAVLTELRDLGLRLAVVSNSDGRLREILAACGLDRFFATMIDSAVVGCEKPDPRIFRLALERVRAAPAEAVHVGDLVAVDVAGARAAGVVPVLIDPDGSRPDAGCARIADLTALPGLLRAAPAAA